MRVTQGSAPLLPCQPAAACLPCSPLRPPSRFPLETALPHRRRNTTLPSPYPLQTPFIQTLDPPTRPTTQNYATTTTCSSQTPAQHEASRTKTKRTFQTSNSPYAERIFQQKRRKTQKAILTTSDSRRPPTQPPTAISKQLRPLSLQQPSLPYPTISRSPPPQSPPTHQPPREPFH